MLWWLGGLWLLSPAILPISTRSGDWHSPRRYRPSPIADGLNSARSPAGADIRGSGIAMAVRIRANLARGESLHKTCRQSDRCKSAGGGPLSMPPAPPQGSGPKASIYRGLTPSHDRSPRSVAAQFFTATNKLRCHWAHLVGIIGPGWSSISKIHGGLSASLKGRRFNAEPGRPSVRTAWGVLWQGIQVSRHGGRRAGRHQAS